MSKLATFLERIYSASGTFRTVRAVIRHNAQASSSLSLGFGVAVGRPIPRTTPSPGLDETLRMWLRPPGEARVETTRSCDGREERGLEVFGDVCFWTQKHGDIVEKGFRDENAGKRKLPISIRRHFDIALLRDCFAALTLTSRGTCRVANRDCLKIRAVRTPGKQLWPHWLSPTVQEFEFAADVRKPALLSIVGIVDGESVESHVVQELEFDESLDDSLFTYEPKGDERLRAYAPILSPVSMEDAVKLASFPVLFPRYVPQTVKVDNAIYEPAKSDDADRLGVYMAKGHDFDYLWIMQSSKPDSRLQELLFWEDISANGLRLELSDPGDGIKAIRVLAVQVSKTWVYVFSDLGREELVRIAFSLEAVNGQIKRSNGSGHSDEKSNGSNLFDE